MKHLLIIYHSQTGHTQQMAEAVYLGTQSPDITETEVRYLRAGEADAGDLIWADGLILGTPENFGYMSGAMKDFFDRTFYAVEGKIGPLPYALFISAGNDGSGAVRAIERIANGYPLNPIQAPHIARGEITDTHLTACRELGTLMAAGLEMGIF